ncbi:beta-lactamase family protein [Rhodococcus sp. ZPP]|uniref:serine hydrolase domain-containing protein n=1 Tax=Rhodococcus sp. ZPP TaxID=2749906 RepID=UPI001AD856B1|nr:serine hydrolase domain-containing protein [Rhodococcus sp. ZPP]QTJ68235.1 beta-lactamase family protein [Rhodococcus sp. ZPP]
MLRRTTILCALFCACVLTAVTAPATSALAPPSSGDPQLVSLAGHVLSRTYRENASVAYVDASGTRFAHFGAADDTEYEIGSLTKTFTAQLFVDAVARGEVREDTVVGELLPLRDAPVADVTLFELASHTSGLAQFPMTTDAVVAVGHWVSATNPFTYDREALLQQVQSAQLGSRGTYAYSTVGFALLGQALAAAAGTDYPSLLRERMLVPLGLSDTWLPLTAADLPADATRGFDVLHRSQEPWPLDAYAPAGGLRSTAADMAGYVRQLIDGTVPGSAAMDQRWIGNTYRALTWSVVPFEGREYTLHGGATGGFQCTVVLDRRGERGLVILTNTIGGLEQQGLDILSSL